MLANEKLTILPTVLILLSLTFQTARADDSFTVKRDDDVSLSSLQVLVQQQASMIQTLQAELQTQKSRITAIESENAALKTEVTGLQNKASKTVAFTARFSADDGINGIAVGTNSPLRFDHLELNTGNGYDPQTGIFTAPVAGTYSFFLSQMGANNRGSLLLAIVKHGVVLDIVYSKDHEDQGSSQVMTHLGVGQQVWVQHNYGNAVRGSWYTVFTGYLLHTD